MFQPLTHFELIFLYGIKYWFSFILFYVAVHASQHHSL